MPRQTFDLTDRQDQVVKALVASGRYRDADDVVRDALRLLEEREAQEATRLTALREAVRAGVVDFEEGRFTRFESADALADYLEVLSKHILSVPAK